MKITWTKFMKELGNPRYQWCASIDPDQPVPSPILILVPVGCLVHMAWTWEGTRLLTTIVSSDNLELEKVEKKYWKARCTAGYDVYLSKCKKNKKNKETK